MCQEVLRVGDTKEAGSSNVHGDQQLELDVAADTLVFAKLKECRVVETASSEETSEMVNLGGQGFSVRFQPYHYNLYSRACDILDVGAAHV